MPVAPRSPAPLRSVAAGQLWALPLAILLAVLAAVLPPATASFMPLPASLGAPVARAADGLAVTTDARYVVLPDQAVVRVTVDMALRNDTPDQVSGGAVTRYFYDRVNVGLQPEATRLAATQDGSPVPVTASRRSGYQLVSVGLRQAVYFQQTAAVRLTFDLPAGRPRSASDVRVGRAFATFLAWAFGDAGTVRVEIPGTFTVDVTGADVRRAVDGTTTVLTASTSDAAAWYAWVDATNDAGLASQPLDIAGGEQVIVRAWPEDSAWRTQVAGLLTRSVPQLVSRIGLPWPVDGPLSVIEVHTPLLEGYAGFYDPATEQITISEDLDDLTIVHEASHAWFNQALFTERWITEGLADEYASRVLVALGEAPQGPNDVARTNPLAFPLNTWPPPAAINDDQSTAREQYGYDASWLVIRQVVTGVGEDGMRRVFAAAKNGTTAYVGAGAPEPAALPNDWRRFVDLTEELGGGKGVAALVRTWALSPGSDAQLAARDAARTAYHALLGVSDRWPAPYAVRGPLDAWTFDVARARISEASRIIALRDETATLAARQALTPPGTLQPAYEDARDAAALASAVAQAGAMETSLEQVARAGDAVAAPRDWLVSLGLAGHDPDADLAAARSGWTAGDAATAMTRATLALSALAAAPGVGRERATLIGAGLVAALLLLALAVVLVRRPSRRRAPATAAPAWGAWPVTLPDGTEPWFGPPAPRPPSRPAASPPVAPWPGPRPPAAGGPAEAPDRYATLPPSAPSGADATPPPIEEQGAEPS